MKIAMGFALGTLPGLALMLLVDARVGLALCILGAFVGTALALPGVSLQRILLALLGGVIDRAVPPLQHIVDLDAADARIPVENDELSTQLLTWLLVPSLRINRGGWFVLTGTIIGGMIGLGVGVHDLWKWFHHDPGLVLPMGPLPVKNSADMAAEAFVLLLATIVWGGSLAAIFASKPWRRSVLTAAGIGAFFSGMIALAVSKPGDFPWEFMVPFTTISAGFALFFFPLFSRELFRDDT